MSRSVAMAWNAGLSHEGQNQLNFLLAMICSSSWEMFTHGEQYHLMHRSHSTMLSFVCVQMGHSSSVSSFCFCFGFFTFVLEDGII